MLANDLQKTFNAGQNFFEILLKVTASTATPSKDITICTSKGFSLTIKTETISNIRFIITFRDSSVFLEICSFPVLWQIELSYKWKFLKFYDVVIFQILALKNSPSPLGWIIFLKNFNIVDPWPISEKASQQPQGHYHNVATTSKVSLEMEVLPVSVDNVIQRDVLATSLQCSTNLVTVLKSRNLAKCIMMSFEHCNNLVSDRILVFLNKVALCL